MADLSLVVQNGNNTGVFSNFRTFAFGGILFANYSMQNIFKLADSITENRKWMERGSWDKNKTNASIILC